MTEKNMLIVLAVAVLLGLGFWVFTRGEPVGQDDVNNPPNQENNTSNTQESPRLSEEAKKILERGDESLVKPETPDENGLLPGLYDTFNTSMLERAKFGGVFLFFRSEFSQSSKTIDEQLRARRTEIPRGVTILVIDYENAPEMREKYEVKDPDTFVKVDENGLKITSWIAGSSFDGLMADIKSK